jgi:hypothetical protein
MKETPIIMSGDHPAKILAGVKTQTRRVLTRENSTVNGRPPSDSADCHFAWGELRFDVAVSPEPWGKDQKPNAMGLYEMRPFVDGLKSNCQYLHVPASDGETVHRVRCKWQPGDRLWVRETFKAFDDGDTYYRADSIQFGADYKPVHADDEPEDWSWTSPIHMPREQSRILLELIEVRVQRVQEISEEDAKAEGVPNTISWRVAGGVLPGIQAINESVKAPARHCYSLLWDTINAKRDGGIYAWDKNPWVWALTFRRIDDSKTSTLAD